jgi:predicted methyltransferase MtxX (methanogen marker protein 4)
MSPASESIRWTFPHSSISASLRAFLITPTCLSKRVARAPIRAVIAVGRLGDLGGKSRHVGSKLSGK